MKTIRHLIALTFVVVLAFAAQASAGGHQTAQSACTSNARIHSIHKSLVAEGYTLDSVDDQQVNYYAIPVAPYSWGTLVYTYSRTVENHVAMIERVQIEVQVQVLPEGYSFPQISIRDQLAQ